MTLSLGNLISLVGTHSTLLLLFNPTPPGSVILLHVGLIGPTMTTTLCKVKDSCVSLICPTCNAHRSTQLPGGKKLRHFACPFVALTKRILKIWKKCQIAEDVRILVLFQIFEIPLFSAPNWHTKWIDLFHPGISQIITAPGRQNTDPHSAQPEEYCKSKKSASLLRMSGLWHFYSGLLNSTSKCSNLACKVNWPVLSRYLHTDPHSTGQKKSIHFACQIGALGSGI
jgi:hypothetical protein